MADAGYHLQYQLYWEALSRWLERMPRNSKAVKPKLGGVLYLFLRGLSGADDGSGVYFVPGKNVLAGGRPNG